MKQAPETYADFTDLCFRAAKEARQRYEIGELLFQYHPEKYRQVVIETGVEAVREGYSAENRFNTALYAARKLGHDAWPMMEECLKNGWTVMDEYDASDDKQALSRCVEHLERQDALIVLKLAAEAQEMPLVPIMALEHIVKLNQGTEDALIEAKLKELIKAKSTPVVARAVRLAGNWDIARMAEPVWAVAGHKSNPVRQAAARALAGLGEGALERAAKLLENKKSEARLAAAALLELIGTPGAIEALESRLDEEDSETVRDAIFRALDGAWTAQGREVPVDEIRRRIVRAKDKMGTPPARWADAALLPPVYLKDGAALEREAVQYLLYRQSRNKEIVADVEAKALYRLIDRQRSHDFAQAVLQAFLAHQPISWEEIKAKNIHLQTLLHDKAGNYFFPNAPTEERWALALAALTGDDRLVKLLVKQVIEWTAPSDGRDRKERRVGERVC
jgi:hypothetical protein